MWIKEANELLFTASNIQTCTELPVDNYLLKFSPGKGFYLEITPKFKLPKKIYGDSEVIAQRYLNTFSNQTNNLGVLLTGLKGTGKSITAKITCYKSNLPVILITEPFTGDGFKSFLSNISQEAIIFIDEFEKVYYDTGLQNSFLSILDGIFEGKKMFLFTSNEKGKINQYMINRPGRVHYLKEYDALDDTIINDVIADNLIIKENRDGLVEVLNILSNVTMDMLMSLIKEMNLYKETARESIRFLNLKPDSINYNVDVYQNNLKLGSTTIHGHPLTTESLYFEVYISDISKYKEGAVNHDAIIAQINHKKNKHKASLEGSAQKGKFINNPSEVSETQKTEEPCEESPATDSTSNSESAYLSFSVDVKNSTINQTHRSVTIIDSFGTKFVFEKSRQFVFGF